MNSFFLLAALLASAVPQADAQIIKPACIDYAKGVFTGGITTTEQCDLACRAERLMRGSTKPCSNGTITGVECQCLVRENSYRDICEDPVCNGAVGPSIAGTFVTMILAMTYYLN